LLDWIFGAATSDGVEVIFLASATKMPSTTSGS
jgi:hypothetical protein